VVEAIELSCSLPVIIVTLERWFRLDKVAPFAEEPVAAMRDQSGGHGVKRDGVV
jgi:6-phosphogluconate dehydrogenase (decarboxylating)